MKTEDLGIEPDALHSSAVLYLLEENERDAAEALLYGRIEKLEVDWDRHWDADAPVFVTMRGPRKTVEALTDYNEGYSERIHAAFSMCLPPDTFLDSIKCRAEIHAPRRYWRAEVLDVIGQGEIANQAVGATTDHTWQGFRSRSRTEIRVAVALDRTGVLFFPLPRARVAIGDNRINTEPDFLVCVDGKWGILEIDGRPYHPPKNAAMEHERDRLFRAHGIRVVERFDATRAYNHVTEVVEEFLAMVRRNG